MVFPHRCAACLHELPRTARRFVVFVPGPPSRRLFDLPLVDIETLEFVADGREEVVCEDCVGWYHDGSIEVTAEEVEG